MHIWVVFSWDLPPRCIWFVATEPEILVSSHRAAAEEEEEEEVPLAGQPCNASWDHVPPLAQVAVVVAIITTTTG